MSKSPPRRRHPPPAAGSVFDVPYPTTPKTSFGEVECKSLGGQTRKATVWTTSKGIDLEGMTFEPADARRYAELIRKAADECDRMRAAEDLAKKNS